MPETITIDRELRDNEQRAVLRTALDEMGMAPLSSSSFEHAFARTREAVDNDGHVRSDRVRAIVDDVVSGMETFQSVADTFR